MNHPWTINAAFGLMFATVILADWGVSPMEVGAGTHGP